MKRLRHFRLLSDGDIMTIIRAGRIRTFGAGQTVFMEGDPSSGLCVLLGGEIHLYKLGPEGQENIIAVIRPVIMFNEVSVLDGGPNPATAIAFKHSVIWMADREAFELGLERFPQLGLGLLPILAKRNRMLADRYADLSFRPVRARLAILLLELSEHGREDINRRENTIQQMAARTATVPVVVSRRLGELREAGLVECTRTLIRVLDAQGLADIAFFKLEGD
jgi:CRP/FNR family transcriptional regulator